ncbi:trypsin-like peptidase domain-containing protein [Aliikangiella sp. IMCC44632]
MFNRYFILKTFIFVLLSTNGIAKESSQWDKVIASASKSVVSIRVNVVRSFDTETAKVTQATGFIVDAERGIIVTNRHVVNPGPITAEAVFSNNEEIQLRPIYRDPVHDFGFFRYDPKALKFISPNALPLDATAAKVGDEIKVIGNDSGEHMSILSGTIARIDRQAPYYSRGGYNDFNTFYFQSSADTSGGSSGAPVINREGKVIALNAGANNRSSSSFFLPLHRVAAALHSIQTNKPIQRGSIETTFDYIPYDQARRLGLTPEQEKAFRKLKLGNGVLAASSVVKDSAADGLIKPGDILISVQSTRQSQGQSLNYINRYEALEGFLDQHVEEVVSIKLARLGKVETIQLKVSDLHLITPAEYLQIANGIFHNFSYQLARQSNLPIKGVYVAMPGYMFGASNISRGSIITELNQKPITNLAQFETALSEVKEAQSFLIKYVNLSAPHLPQVANLKKQTNWHLNQKCRKNDNEGRWKCVNLNWSGDKEAFIASKIYPSKHADPQVKKVSPSLVLIDTTLPYHIDGHNYKHYSGTGLILDTKTGLVLTDKNTVPVKMADVTITIGGIAEIPAQVVYVHPTHSFVFIQYDPARINAPHLRSAELSNKPLKAGDSAWLVGYQASNRLISEKVNISSFEHLALPQPRVPRSKEINTNSVIVTNPPAVASGVLMDKRGRVRSWWTNFSLDNSGELVLDRGLPINTVISMRDQWLKTGRVEFYSLETEFSPITLASARNFGVPEKWLLQLQKKGDKPQVLRVMATVAGSNAAANLNSGDLLLAVDDQVVQSFEQLDLVSNKPSVTLTLWRDQKEIKQTITTTLLQQDETQVAFLWAGALIQSAHRAVNLQHKVDPSSVYISWYWYGSPANRYGLSPLRQIVEFQGITIQSLNHFIQLSQQYQSAEYVSLRLKDLVGRESILSLRQDFDYWPTQKIFWNGKSWQNTLVK